MRTHETMTPRPYHRPRLEIINVRLPADLIEALDAEAEAHNLSRSQVLRDWLDRGRQQRASA